MDLEPRQADSNLDVHAWHHIVQLALVGSRRGPLVVTHDHTLLQVLQWMILRAFGFPCPTFGCIAPLVDRTVLEYTGPAWYRGLAGAPVKHVVVLVVDDVGFVVSTWRDLHTIGRRIDANDLGW